MTLTKKTGQNIIEFVFVFFVTMSIFLSIIELSLYWRAKYSIANIANEISANVQIASQNSKSANTIIEVAQNSLKKSAGLLNLESSTFSLSGSNDSYQIKSNFIFELKNLFYQLWKTFVIGNVRILANRLECDRITKEILEFNDELDSEFFT